MMKKSLKKYFLIKKMNMEDFVLFAKDLFYGSFAVQSVFTIFFITIQFFENKQVLSSLLLTLYMGIIIAYIIKIITFNSKEKIIKFKLCYSLIYCLLAMIIIFLFTSNFHYFSTTNLTNVFIGFIVLGWISVSIKCILYFMYEVNDYVLIEDDIEGEIDQ